MLYFTIFYLLLTEFVCIHNGLPMDTTERKGRQEEEEIEHKLVYRKDLLRYAKRIIKEIDVARDFLGKLQEAKEEDMLSGKTVADNFHLIQPEVRTKLNEIKQKEIKYQQKKVENDGPHLKDVANAKWNPINRANKETFDKEDLQLLYVELHNRNEDVARKKNFKEYEMEKERERQKKLKTVSAEEKALIEAMEKERAAKSHEKVHEPGHKAQIEEVWEKQDGMDKESFDLKTFFNLHDKNGDGYLDEYEYKTIFLTDLDKVYNESDSAMDENEREEDMKEMWEFAMKEHDANKDGMIAYDEFIQGSRDENFEADNEWKPVSEKQNFTPEEYERYKLDRKLTQPKEEGDEDEEDDENFEE